MAEHAHIETYLIIDDDPVFAEVLLRALQRRGHGAFAVHGEQAAWDLLQQQAVSRIVLDLKLGQDSSLTFIPKLKSAQPAIEIVVLTGYSSIATAVEAIKLGATHYLCKPADTDEIIAAFDATRGQTDVPLLEQTPSFKRLEWEHIQTVLSQHAGNVSASARTLGMHRRTLQRKLRKRPVKQ
jgi:two-component system response regulator RegA